MAVVPVGSTGVPSLEPLALATRDGRTGIHTKADAERCGEIAGEFAGGRPQLHAHADGEPGVDDLASDRSEGTTDEAAGDGAASDD